MQKVCVLQKKKILHGGDAEGNNILSSSFKILHLGDSHSRDFLGARNAGWSALLYGEPKLENEQISCFSELLDYLP